MNETTDQSSIKQCCFTAVVYVSKTNNVEHLFLDMVEVSSGTATGLYECLNQMLRNKNIPIEDMVGFKRFASYCSGKMLMISSSKACLKLPRNVEDFLRSVGAYFSRSSHKQLKFKEFQEFFQVEIHKILAPAQTRWLLVKACVDRVLEQYIQLKAYLTEAVFSDPSKTTEEMLMTMNNQFTVKPLLHKLKSEVENLLKRLSANFMKISYVKSCANILNADFRNATHFLGLDKINIGVKAGESMDNLKKDENDPLFFIISAVNPSEAQQFKIKSLVPVLKRFPVLNKFVTAQKLDDEWRAHAMLDFAQHGLEFHRDNIDAECYWGKVFHLKNGAGQYLFPNIKIVMSLSLILPFSNASVKPIFSVLKNLKTENRNRLNTDTVVSLMVTKEAIKELGGSVKFKQNACNKNMKRVKDKK
ncbi:hypothetical protein ILUMI_19826 [Ignelater luminosus]|uniref:HAT C-terminal dimerisation domain-containing protein n=1 Tax=Ignelater luminosus TaxID=2038154 RepID=A0A8K0G5G8_IGNLU|nr:hypothetical protein ILUMI_19826 [Ignelater luminosus]